MNEGVLILISVSMAETNCKAKIHKNKAGRDRALQYLKNNINIAISSAEIIVSRAGEGEIFEIAAFGKPSILIPLPGSANNHQLQNAKEYSKTGAALVIEEKNLSSDILVEAIGRLLRDKSKLAEMSNTAKSFYFQNSALNLAEITLSIIR